MSEAINQLITEECRLGQIKDWLRTVHKINMEEFIVLYKVQQIKKVSGRTLRLDLNHDLDWSIGKIDVLVRNLYRKRLISKERCENDERVVYYTLNNTQARALNIIKEDLARKTIA